MDYRTRNRICRLIARLRRLTARAEKLLPPQPEVGTRFTRGALAGCTVTKLTPDGALLRADGGWQMLVRREALEWHVERGYAETGGE